MTNPYINTHEETEQDLLEDLIDESIQIHGEKFYYIPRKLSGDDSINIFNEDRNSIFEHAHQFTGYLENANMGLEGNGYLMQKFGAVVDYNATITVSRREWAKEVGFNGTTPLPDSPCSGDLIYWPLTDQLFEIKFVDDKLNPFAQLGAFYTYRITVELMQYSSQTINTGINDIDKFETLKTFDTNADNSLWGGIVRFDIVKPGDGYQEPPEVVIDSLTGSGAKFFVDLNEDSGAINDIVVTDPGFGYHSMDKAYVIGQCTDRAVVVPVIRTIVENAGEGYGTNTPNLKKAMELTNVSPETSPFGAPPYPDTLDSIMDDYIHDDDCAFERFNPPVIPAPPLTPSKPNNGDHEDNGNFGLNSI